MLRREAEVASEDYAYNERVKMNKTDFSKLTNSEINLKLRGYDNEYNVKKDKVIKLIRELQELDAVYNEAKAELSKRGLLE